MSLASIAQAFAPNTMDEEASNAAIMLGSVLMVAAIALKIISEYNAAAIAIGTIGATVIIGGLMGSAGLVDTVIIITLGVYLAARIATPVDAVILVL